MLNTIAPALRALQALLGVVIFVISVNLVRQMEQSQSLINYSVFVGFSTIVAGAVGAASIFLDNIRGIIVVGLDALLALFLLSGGVAWAVEFGQVAWICDVNFDNGAVNDEVGHLCKQYRADEGLVFAAFFLTAILLGLGFVMYKRRRSTGSSADIGV